MKNILLDIGLTLFVILVLAIFAYGALDVCRAFFP